MTRAVFKEENLGFYGEKVDQLIPLNRWDFRDNRDRERGKSPRDNDWRTKGYSSAALTSAIEAGCNLGFRLTDRDLVVDMDPRNMDRSLDEAIAFLRGEFGMTTDGAPIVSTGSGGLHIYLRVPADWVGIKLRNELEVLPGVEFKGLGRQVVASGSRHPNGTYYSPTPDSGAMSSTPEVSVKLLTALRKPDVDPSKIDREITVDQLEEMLATIDPTEFNDNESWLRLAMACHAATGGLGREAFIAWSTQDEDYADHAELIGDRWDSFQGTGISAGTLFKEVIDRGHGDLIRERPEEAFDVGLTEQDAKALELEKLKPKFEADGNNRPKRTVYNVRVAIEDMGITVRRNLLTDTNYLDGNLSDLTEHHTSVSGIVDDDVLHAVRSAITEKYRFEPSIQQVSEAISALSLKNQFHPIRDYLNKLEWDGHDRISEFFTRYCGTQPTPYATAVAEVMFKAAIGRVYRPGVKFDTMVVLEGTQGCGKSTLIQILGGEFALEGLPNKADLNNKDVIQAIQGHWLVEVEELAVMRKGEIDSIKAFLSRTSDKARFAYAREAKEYPRQCVFIGTTNDAQYLLDSTGNRRFLPIAVEFVALEQIRDDRDQIWAQALSMWRTNPTEQALMLDESLWGVAAEEQSQRRLYDPIETKLAMVLSQAEKDGVDFVATDELLLNVLSQLPGQSDQADVRRLSRAVQAVGEPMGWRGGRRNVGGLPTQGVVKR